MLCTLRHMQPRTHLQRVIRDEGRKQSWLAHKVGLDQSDLSKIVNGKLIADEATRVRIAEALGKTTDELWPDAQVAA